MMADSVFAGCAETRKSSYSWFLLVFVSRRTPGSRVQFDTGDTRPLVVRIAVHGDGPWLQRPSWRWSNGSRPGPGVCVGRAMRQFLGTWRRRTTWCWEDPTYSYTSALPPAEDGRAGKPILSRSRPRAIGQTWQPNATIATAWKACRFTLEPGKSILILRSAGTVA